MSRPIDGEFRCPFTSTAVPIATRSSKSWSHSAGHTSNPRAQGAAGVELKSCYPPLRPSAAQAATTSHPPPRALDRQEAARDVAGAAAPPAAEKAGCRTSNSCTRHPGLNRSLRGSELGRPHRSSIGARPADQLAGSGTTLAYWNSAFRSCMGATRSPRFCTSISSPGWLASSAGTSPPFLSTALARVSGSPMAMKR